MVATAAPVTREDLRTELDRLRDEFTRHYATKADLAQLETRLTKQVSDLQARLMEDHKGLMKEMGLHLRWLIGLNLGGMAVIATTAVALSQLFGK